MECREERGGKEFAWCAALPIGDRRKSVKELLDGGIAQGLDGELQALDALFRCGDNSRGVNDAEAGGSKDEVERGNSSEKGVVGHDLLSVRENVGSELELVGQKILFCPDFCFLKE